MTPESTHWSAFVASSHVGKAFVLLAWACHRKWSSKGVFSVFLIQPWVNSYIPVAPWWCCVALLWSLWERQLKLLQIKKLGLLELQLFMCYVRRSSSQDNQNTEIIAAQSLQRHEWAWLFPFLSGFCCSFWLCIFLYLFFSSSSGVWSSSCPFFRLVAWWITWSWSVGSCVFSVARGAVSDWCTSHLETP